MFEELVDIKENNIFQFDYELLTILLKDMTTNKNIIWGTDNYIVEDVSILPTDEIKIEQIIGYNGNVIKPRTKKSKIDQAKRVRDKAEVFTPAWICNKQNNLIDNVWFSKENVFNVEKKTTWKPTKEKIVFPKGKTWQDYVKENRLEIACGEAPYLVSRYDTTNGNVIPVMKRIGLLDRKMRIINENVIDEEEWLEWTINAFKSIYGYEWQGDSLLIARENLLYTFSDNYIYKFKKKPSVDLVKQMAHIIVWNIFQMDGLKFVIPYSCYNKKKKSSKSLNQECLGCKKNNYKNHNGTYVKIMNWETNRRIKFISVMNRRSKNARQRKKI